MKDRENIDNIVEYLQNLAKKEKIKIFATFTSKVTEIAIIKENEKDENSQI